MGRRNAATALVAAAAAAIIAGSTFVYASPTAAVDGGDTFNVAPGTSVSMTTTTVTISVPSTSPAMVITCTTSSITGTTKASLTYPTGLPILADASGGPCTDSLGFTDSFAANTTNGPWSVREKDFTNSGAGDEGLPEPNAAGDKLVIGLPKAGLVDTNNWPCSFTFAPAGAATISGAYNDAGKFAIKNAKLPVAVSGPPFCGPASQTVTLTTTYSVSPAIFDIG